MAIARLYAKFYNPTLNDEDISVQEVLEKTDISTEIARRISEDIVSKLGLLYGTETIGKALTELD